MITQSTLIQTQKYIVFSLKIRNILYLLRPPVCAFYHFNCTLKNYFSLALGFIILGLRLSIVAANFHLAYCFCEESSHKRSTSNTICWIIA